MTNKGKRYTIHKISNGNWRVTWEDGSFSTHSTQSGAEKMVMGFLSENNQKLKQEAVEMFYKKFVVRCSDGDLLKDEDPKKVKLFLGQIIDIAVEETQNKIINIILERTRIPRGARNPTRDATVILGEELVDLIKQK